MTAAAPSFGERNSSWPRTVKTAESIMGFLNADLNTIARFYGGPLP